jgi:hypothetical protein
MAVDRSNHRDRQIDEGPVHPLEQLMLTHPLLAGHAIALFQVSPGTKNAVTRAGEDDAPHIPRIFGQSHPEVVQVAPHLGVQGIAHFRAIERDLQHMRLDHLGANGFVGGKRHKSGLWR